MLKETSGENNLIQNIFIGVYTEGFYHVNVLQETTYSCATVTRKTNSQPPVSRQLITHYCVVGLF